MRFVILDAKYPAFLEGVYRDQPELEKAPYAEQLRRIHAGMFGEAGFQADALRSLGHEAEVIVTNAYPAQRAWAREHGLAHLARSRRTVRLRRGFVPWCAALPQTPWELVLAQVAEYRPDVVYVGIIDTMPPLLARELRRLTRFLVAQVATALPDATYGHYDLVLSSIPALVDRFREMGVQAELVPLAFEPSVLERVPVGERDIQVSFVGSFTDAYKDRVQILEAVARAAPLQMWTADSAYLPPTSELHRTIRGSAFGRDMYSILGRSVIALNTHGTVSGPDANNLRLYEATGMGALLITDRRRNLHELFDVGSDLVTFGSPQEAARLVCHYLDRLADAAEIAGKGQQRTLRDHTWKDRMVRLSATVAARI